MTDLDGARTIACPSCGDSTSVEIQADPRAPLTRTEETFSVSWDARCGGCGTGWSFVDRI